MSRRHVSTVTEHKNTEIKNHTCSFSTSSGAKINLKCFYSFFLPSCFLSLLPPFLATFNIFFHSHYLCFLDISSFLPSWLVYYILLPCFLSHHSFLPSFLPSVCPVSFIIPSLHYVPFCHKFPLPSFLLPSVLICYIVLIFLYTDAFIISSLLVSFVCLPSFPDWFLKYSFLTSFCPCFLYCSFRPSFCSYFLVLSSFFLSLLSSPVLLFYLSSLFLHSGLPPLPSSLFPSSSLPVFCLPSFLPSVSLYISSSHCLCGRRVTTSVISSCLSSPRRYISSLYVLSPRLQVCSVSDSMKVKIKETCVRLPAVHPLTHLK